MYKGASANLQRRTSRIIEADTSTYVSEDDLVLSADNMGLRECQTERASLILRKTQAENQLAAAKALRDLARIKQLGLQIQGVCARLSNLSARIKTLNREDHGAAFMDAAREVLPPDMLRKVSDRQSEILAERRTHTTAA